MTRFICRRQQSPPDIAPYSRFTLLVIKRIRHCAITFFYASPDSLLMTAVDAYVNDDAAPRVPSHGKGNISLHDAGASSKRNIYVPRPRRCRRRPQLSKTLLAIDGVN